MLATLVLIASVGSSFTFGHAHEGGDREHHHLGWSSEHDARHGDLGHEHEEHDGPESPSLGPNEFHLHTVLFGIPFTLPGAGLGFESGKSNPYAFADGYLTASSPIAAKLLQLIERIPWSFLGPLVGPGHPSLDPISRRAHHLIDAPAPWCSPHARSVVLRC